ncbi:carboxypeptidase regulatory-like domain-containing protein [Paraburkholderia sp. A3BS-1L]|uniref:carboxypeptidase regulatory-like domain-containing protein n=1 Tax=Paraburkholderia sp. A3BS-1L TaxID=3028375 RepID=UPI003DA9844C
MTATYAALPQEAIQRQEQQVSVSGVKYVSGGIGSSSQQAMNRVRKEYDLRLTFARSGTGEFLSDVHVRAEDAHRKLVLDVLSHGPLLFAHLPSGTYRVTAAFNGNTLVRRVKISTNHPKELVFYFAE